MSLIVARKEGDRLAIVSDTKLTYPYHEVKAQKTHPSDGVLKTVILDGNTTISYAGEISYAEDALKEIGTNITVDNIIEILNTYHKLSEYKTEFLYCTGSPSLLYKFKNNECGEVHSCYLGDSKAFRLFQGFMMDMLPKKPKPKSKKKNNKDRPQSSGGLSIEFEEFRLTMTTGIDSPLFLKMTAAMDYVIEEGSVASVGGFKVFVMFDGKFQYRMYNAIYRQPFVLLGPGSHPLGHGNAMDGAYSIHFFGGSEDGSTAAIHIKQATFGFVYSRQDCGLPRPQIFYGDEVDFIDTILPKFAIKATITNEDRVLKYFKAGLAFFNTGDWQKCVDELNKVIDVTKEKERANFLFYLGMAHWNLGNRTLAMKSFTEAIQTFPQIRANIDRAFKGALSNQKKSNNHTSSNEAN